jgi:hypothetical protein
VVYIFGVFPPTVGSLLTEHIGWRTGLLVTPVLATLVVVITLRYVPETQSSHRGTDLLGLLLIAVALVGVTYGISDLQSGVDLAAIASILTGVGAAVAFAAARRTTTVAHRVHQTILEPPHGNALQACAASILGLPLNLVPNFVVEVDHWDAMLRFAALRGLTLIKVNLDGGLLPHKTRPGTLCIARGSSPRGNHAHVTVAMVTCDGRALELAHDPHPTGDGLAGEPSWAAFFVPASRFT